MKQLGIKTLVVVLAFLTVIFCVLWQRALHDDSRVSDLARSGVQEARTRFSDFRTRGAETDYWGGVAAFRVFEEAHLLLSEDTAEHIACSELYGSLLLHPEQAREHLPELQGILELLLKDMGDASAFVRMTELCREMEQ